MPFNSPVLDALFLFSVAVIWSMILYQLYLTISGYRYRNQFPHPIDLPDPETLPPVSILIPARNEEIVIKKTIETMTRLDYPRNKLEIIIIDDGSTDETAAVLKKAAANDSRIKPVLLPRAEIGSGKSHALNTGIKSASHPYIAVYDADNNPEPQALKHLISHLLADDKLAGVIGKFRTLNRRSNLLTRFINIETLSFQWILQAGRYHAFKVAILPGTNFIVRREVIEQCGGWDEMAITEDAELSVRIYREGWQLKFVPTAVTWEQEPESLGVWIRQRTRWVRGNNYVIKKFTRDALKLSNRFLFMEFLYLFILYYLFLGAIVTSHLLFILCGLGVLSVTVPGPYTVVWLSAFVLFLLEISLVLSYEDEDNPLNILTTALMYLTYCQLWLVVVFRGFFLDITKKQMGIWDKTVRISIEND